jgi:hypothetical protein
MSRRLRQLKKRFRKRFSWYRESPLVYVFQMGKVASTAITSALLKRRIECYQPHFLSRSSFEQLFALFEDVNMTEWTVDHLSGQIAENLRLYNKLVKFQNGWTEPWQRLKIITLTRNPLDWYFSNLAQNFGEYRQDVALFIAEVRNVQINSQDDRQVLDHLEDFINCLLEFASRHLTSFCPAEHARMGKLIQDNTFSESPGNSLLFKHSLILLRPFNWFDVHFDPVFNTHVVKSVLSDGFASSTIKLDYCDILILRYEDLFSSAIDSLEDFIPECKPLSLKRQNVTSHNKIGTAVYDVKNGLVLPGSLQRAMKQSPYMRAFYPS